MRRVKKQLVERRATTESNLAGQCVISKQLNSRAGKNQILLNLRVVSPRRSGAPSQAGQRTIRRAKADRIGEIQVTQEKLVAVGGPTSDREPARYIRKKLGIEGKQGVPEIGIDRGRKTHASRRMEIKRQPW